MGDKDGNAWNEKVLNLGFYNHAFMPSTPTGPAHCIWEAKSGITAAQMQEFIDGPDGLSRNAFSNEVLPINLESSNPPYPRKFGGDGKAMAAPKSGGSSLMCTTRCSRAASTRGGSPSASSRRRPAPWRHGEEGGRTRLRQPLLCAVRQGGPHVLPWECNAGKSPAEFQAFIDGENGVPKGCNTIVPVNLELTEGDAAPARLGN